MSGRGGAIPGAEPPEAAGGLGPYRRIAVRLPNWVGDVVMATPALRAVRASFPEAEIAYVGRRRLFPIIEGAPWYDRLIEDHARGLFGPFAFGARMRREGFDLALLLPHSFRTALTWRIAGARRRVGYALQGRSALLTDALPITHWEEGSLKKLKPIPMVELYLGLVEAAGGRRAGANLELPATPAACERADRALEAAGVRPGEPLLGLAVGAAFGPSKLWVPSHFAEVADHYARERGARPVFFFGPDERAAVAEIEPHLRAARPVNGSGSGVIPLGDVMGFMRRCELLVATDSGMRHFGVAAGIPVVVVMGPTHPGYTEVQYDRYEVLLEKPDCWPCHLRVCPIDHRCMTRLRPEKAIAAADRLLAKAACGKVP